MKRSLVLSLLSLLVLVFTGCIEGEAGADATCSLVDNMDKTTSLICGADTTTVASGCNIVTDTLTATTLIICGTDTTTVVDGVDGADGANGAPGADGADLIATGGNCTVCHNSGTELVARQQQYALSTHANGAHATYGNRTSCAGCHTHEGFLEVVAAGINTNEGTAAAFESPTQPNCRTCHNIHDKYDGTDWALRVTDTVGIRMNIDTTQLFAFGTGNICASCHQSRRNVPVADSVKLSSHYGPHHGPQGPTLQSTGAFSFAGQTTALPAKASGHAGVTNTCVTCHMANEADGLTTESGGHQFGIVNADGSNNLVGCATCHTDEDLLDSAVTALQTDVATKLAQIETLLAAKGIAVLDTTTGEYHLSSVMVSATDAGAAWNYMMVAEDHSKGVHNPSFVRAVLANTIEYLTPAP